MSSQENKTVSTRFFQYVTAHHCDCIRWLEGKLKTIIDGAIAEPTQRKAVKDLVNSELWEHHSGYVEFGRTVANYLAEGLNEQRLPSGKVPISDNPFFHKKD